jgi:ABC-type amino acid transport substrate-binding protein
MAAIYFFTGSTTAVAEPFTIRHGLIGRAQFSVTSNNEVVGGVSFDIVDELSQRIGISAEHHLCPPRRCLRRLQEGSLDLILFLVVTPELKKDANFIEVWPNPVDLNFYQLREDPRPIKHFDDLYSLKIGTINGFYYAPIFDNDKKLSKFEADTEAQLLHMLKNYRIDTFINPNMNKKLIIERNPDVKVAPFTLKMSDTVLFSVSKESLLSEKLPELERVAKEMINDGALDDIWNKYFKKRRAPIPESHRQ